MNKISVFFALIIFFEVNSIFAATPEDNFLKELSAISGMESNFQYNSQKLPQPTPEQITQFEMYDRTIPFYRKLFSAFITKVMLNLQDENIALIKEFYKKQKVITKDMLIDYFNPLITKKKFVFKSGDIICVAYHSERSYMLANAINSPYEHADLIYINKDNMVRVLVLMNGKVLHEVPLYEYLTGKPHTVSRFAIYRYNKDNLDKDEMNYILYLISKNSVNIYYDNAFIRKTSITGPEKFFSVPRFYYCGELVYSVYEYVLKNTGFDSLKYVSLPQCFKRSGVKETAMNKLFLSFIVKEELEKNQKIIIPGNFIYSDFFSSVAEIGDNTPVNLSESKD